MSKTIYEAGEVGCHGGFSITKQDFGIYAVETGNSRWSAVSPEKLREAADAIEQHRDRGLVEFEDNGGDSYRVNLDSQGNATVEAVDGATSVVWLSKSQIGELIQKVINAKEASSV